MDPSALSLLRELAIAGALGLLIGLEREHSKGKGTGEIAAGIRTLALISIWGLLAARFSEQYTPWVLVISLVGLSGLQTASYWINSRKEHAEPGLTSPVVGIVTFLIGTLVHVHSEFVAIVLAVAVTAVLAFKPQIHSIARGLTQEHVQAILEFVILMAVVLPLLPTDPIDPQGAIRPREVGLMVTLIAGIGLVGFLLMKLAGTERGLRVMGILAGLVSSTALVFSFSRHSQKAPRAARDFGLAMGLACAIMYGRVLVEVVVVRPTLLAWLAPPVGAMMGASYLAYRVLSRKPSTTGSAAPDLEIRNPTELGTALKFGAIYAAIRWASVFLQENTGEHALYLLALVAGMSDVDPITLSLSQMAGEQISHPVAMRAIVLAAISNTLVKLGLVWWLAHRDARRIVAILLAAAGGAGALALGASFFFW